MFQTLEVHKLANLKCSAVQTHWRGIWFLNITTWHVHLNNLIRIRSSYLSMRQGKPTWWQRGCVRVVLAPQAFNARACGTRQPTHTSAGVARSCKFQALFRAFVEGVDCECAWAFYEMCFASCGCVCDHKNAANRWRMRLARKCT